MCTFDKEKKQLQMNNWEHQLICTYFQMCHTYSGMPAPLQMCMRCKSCFLSIHVLFCFLFFFPSPKQMRISSLAPASKFLSQLESWQTLLLALESLICFLCQAPFFSFTVLVFLHHGSTLVSLSLSWPGTIMQSAFLSKNSRIFSWTISDSQKPR